MERQRDLYRSVDRWLNTVIIQERQRGLYRSADISEIQLSHWRDSSRGLYRSADRWLNTDINQERQLERSLQIN